MSSIKNLIVNSFNTARGALSGVLGFLEDHHLLYTDKNSVARIALSLLIIAVTVVATLAMWAFLVLVCLLTPPLLTYLGWNWTLPSFGGPHITFTTAVGLNISVILLLWVLRKIVSCIRR